MIDLEWATDCNLMRCGGPPDELRNEMENREDAEGEQKEWGKDK